MKRSQSLTVSCLVLITLFACTSKKTDEAKAEEVTGEENVSTPVAAVDYTPVPDKPTVAAYYQLDHIKEWYPERILPPAFDFNVDITNKSVNELWLLRNEIFARNGYLFEESVLRGHFNQFKWYQPIFDVPEFKVELNEQEQQFVDKVLKREEELLKTRYSQMNGYTMVNLDHVYNLSQFKSIDNNLADALRVRNFSIVQAKHEQLFHVYDKNVYEWIPHFITTDLYLQVLHKHFSSTLQKVEEEKFIPLVTALLKNLYDQSNDLLINTTDARQRTSAAFTNTYLGVAYSLITNKNQDPDDETLTEEFNKIMEATAVGSKFLDFPILQYSQFTPRGNYTKTEALQHYFRCVKWLNTAPIMTTKDEGLLSAVMIAAFIKKAPETLEPFERFNEAIKLIVGDEDHLSIGNLVSIISVQEANSIATLSAPEKLKTIRQQLNKRDINMIKPKGGNRVAQEKLAEQSVLFTAGRYTFDAEILSRLVNTLQPQPKRPFPKGLDVFASFGNATAKNILLNDFKEQNSWPAFPDSLKNLQNKFSRYTDWNKNIYTKTFESIKTLSADNDKYPPFMKTPQWAKKNLNTSLAAWTELKHDMLLYAEQPYAAQAGQGGGPPPPKHISYVEPNVKFWEKSLELLDFQQQKLASLNLLTEKTEAIITDLREIATLLLTVSRKELANETITPEEFRSISYMGGRIEYLTFRIFDSDHLPEKERLVAVVADVYNNNGTYLEEAIGMVDEIYVIAEIQGKPYLTRGAVFSYYEFTNPTPLSDEAWQTLITSDKPPAKPTWMKEIIVNAPSLESKPGYSF